MTAAPTWSSRPSAVRPTPSTTPLKAAQPEARIVIVGIFTAPSRVDGLALVVKEVDIVGSSMYGVGAHGREFASTIDALVRYSSEVGFMQTHQYPLSSTSPKPSTPPSISPPAP